MKRHIKKVAVIGSGIMGSGIACHFANIGVEVLLLDIVPRELNKLELKKGLSIDNKLVRNRIVNQSLKNSLASNNNSLSVFSPGTSSTSGIRCGGLNGWAIILRSGDSITF